MGCGRSVPVVEQQPAADVQGRPAAQQQDRAQAPTAASQKEEGGKQDLLAIAGYIPSVSEQVVPHSSLRPCRLPAAAAVLLSQTVTPVTPMSSAVQLLQHFLGPGVQVDVVERLLAQSACPTQVDSTWGVAALHVASFKAKVLLPRPTLPGFPSMTRSATPRLNKRSIPHS